jgi:hypothetical protein|uniref:Uncharacterized protein n=1 Tax=Podoviridae sp. ctZkC8 TaxID=2825259 RepID=A0A8S5UBV5_9CAUD|nr:MAG TPA: hypothetical protein [Podoviridae sp. ctZkC8]
MNDGIKKGVVVYRKNRYGHLYNVFLVEGTRGSTILCKNKLGKRTTLERDDFYPVKVPSLRISKEEMDKVIAGVRVFNHNITQSWIDVVEGFKEKQFEIIRLTHANRKVYVMLESINRSVKNKIVKESANGTLAKQIFSIRCAIWDRMFE